MNIRVIISVFIAAGILAVTGCRRENRELKKDTVAIAGVMCRSLEAMKNLKMADPADSTAVEKLQKEYRKIQDEMAILYRDFNTKYRKDVAKKEFSREFRKYLNEAMLDCKSLSKEDRETFERKVDD